MPNVLNQALKGVPLEECCPYIAHDTRCKDRCKDWWKTGKKLKSWKRLFTPEQMKEELLKHGPIVATMAVHQSFLNYKGGIYHSLGINDPIVGYHAVCLVGFDDEKEAWLLRNSWGRNWGIEGYCWIRYSDSEIEQEAYGLELDGEIEPEDDDEEEDSDCVFAKAYAGLGNFFARLLKRKTRFKAIVKS